MCISWKNMTIKNGIHVLKLLLINLMWIETDISHRKNSECTQG
ncbi:calcium-dependent protein kinase 18 isoform X2 [Iris pallida]|uniref:Calcium-dependent protein kinase 18 isoform X2 n=1 Tax=Iris pallida TaxID=29817 RepID=A0AAX6GDQ4_IRIPA|nr:calcium-dependent protein kinase 18 isoform X2 [Iris pallida]KAJ6826455.1 calcium-dependent protein kinase 18 isoform X2 [Iris pallida]